MKQMDATDRCIEKIEKFQADFSRRCDKINAGLQEMHRYNLGTMLLIVLLWGFGLPITFMIIIIVTAKMR